MTTKEKPILFSGPMVKAILAGTKTQTRRALKPQPRSLLGTWRWQPKGFNEFHWDDRYVLLKGVQIERACPYGQAGDRLWVRETFGIHRECPPCDGPVGKGWLHYVADDSGCPRTLVNRLKPSIFMRREYSRITLEIVSVRVERLQDISEADVLAEGIQLVAVLQFGWREDAPCYGLPEWVGTVDACRFRETAKDAYAQLWESINGPGSWSVNPLVWVIEFKRL